MSDKVVPGPRLAFRVEGHMWNCYMARHDTMEGAALIASIAMRMAEDKECKRAFMDLIKAGLEKMIVDATGGEVHHWENEVLAPESERSGHG